MQVSRLANPLVNEVVIPLGEKDRWNASDPSDDADFAGRYLAPEVTRLENGLYSVLDDAPATSRDDLAAILLTGVDLRAVWDAAVPHLPEPPHGVVAGAAQHPAHRRALHRPALRRVGHAVGGDPAA